MEPWEKVTISVRRLKRFKNPGDQYEDIKAYCVGGACGIKAFWLEDKIVRTASGDDGQWWETDGGFHIDWLHKIFATLGYIQQEDKRR